MTRDGEADERESLVEDRVQELEAALVQAIEVIEWCGLNDKTPPYRYGDPRPNGDKPGIGKTFNTPREFSRWWPDRLRDVLNGQT